MRAAHAGAYARARVWAMVAGGVTRGAARPQACAEGLLRHMLRSLTGKREALVPYNLVHELYNTDPRVVEKARGDEDEDQEDPALSLDELKTLQVWYARVLRVSDRPHK